MGAGEAGANRGQIPAEDPARPGWILAASFIALGSLLTELAPLVFGTGGQAVLDWSFGYVTMKFILLPVVSVLVIGCFLIGFVSRRSVTAVAATAGVLALYLVQLALWPLPFKDSLWQASFLTDFDEVNLKRGTADEHRTPPLTAEALAKALNLRPIPVSGADAAYVAAVTRTLQQHDDDDVILIIGHLNTFLPLLHALGHPQEEKIGDFEHDDIFVVVPKGSGRPTVLRLNF